MENSAILKINRLGRIGVIIIRILKIIFIFWLAVSLVGLFTWGYVPKGHVTFHFIDKIVVEADSDLGSIFLNTELGEITLDHSEETDKGPIYWGEHQKYSLDNPGILMLLSVVRFAIYYAMLRYGGKLCRSIRSCRSPFDPEIISGLKKLEIAMIPWALFSVFTDVFGSVFLMKGKPSLTININQLLPVFILYFLLFAFQYGAQLQQESDETI